MAGSTPKLIKQLRDLTGAGMLDCKKALNESEGDIEKATAFLRESGLSKAAKKSNNVTAEGLISLFINDDFSKGTLAEINAQTDFVAKNDEFIGLTKTITSHIFDTKVNTTEELNKTTIDGTNFEEYLNGRIAIIGENIIARKMATVSDDNLVVNGYVHSNGRVGVMISATCDASAKEKAQALLKSICMHASAMKPTVLSYADLSKEFVESENKAIIADIEKENEELVRLKKPLKNIPQYVSQVQLTAEAISEAKNVMKEELLAQGKPEKIIDNILKGKVARWVEDNTQLDKTHALLSQTYVLDDSKTVEEAIAACDKSIKLVDYIRFELGDGVEKKEEDFAAEVAAQLQ
jgi:elongation factor Ts